jgi:predicted dehydrogenase
MNTKGIRIGVVGAGNNTRKHHIPKLQAIDGVSVVSVANRSLDSSQNVAGQFGIPKVYEHWQELVNADDTDAIIIGTWPNMHARVTLAALKAGKHVMCEARMASTFLDAKAMLEAAQTKPHLITQIVPSPFTLAVDTTVKRLLAEGFLGNVLAVEVTEKGTFIDKNSPLTWRQDADISGINIMGLGIWYEALMRWVGEATRVTAVGQTFVKMRPSPDGSEIHAVQIPDHLDVIAEMACGAQAHFGLSRVSGLGPSVAITLYGSEATLQFKDGQLYGAQRGDDNFHEIAIPPHEAGGWRVEEEFIAAIRGLEPIRLTTFETGLNYMAFTEAVWRSLSEERSIPLHTITGGR